MQDVGPQQLLMLLLVIEPDLDDRNDLRQRRVVRALDQRLDRAIDMRAIGRDLLRVRPRDQPALGPRVPRARRDVIGIEQIGEALVERAIVRRRAA